MFFPWWLWICVFLCVCVIYTQYLAYYLHTIYHHVLRSWNSESTFKIRGHYTQCAINVCIYLIFFYGTHFIVYLHYLINVVTQVFNQKKCRYGEKKPMWHVIVHVVLIGGQTKQIYTKQDNTSHVKSNS